MGRKKTAMISPWDSTKSRAEAAPPAPDKKGDASIGRKYPLLTVKMREDLKKELMVFSISNDRSYWEVVEDAVIDYLAKHNSSTEKEK